MTSATTIKINYEQGTIVLQAEIFQADFQSFLCGLDFIEWDHRIDAFRLHAIFYRQMMSILTKQKIEFVDHCKQYQQLTLQMDQSFISRNYQEEALTIWMKKKRGIVILPTGAGKSYFAMLAMKEIQRSTLIIVPTIDLLQQWHQKLVEAFQITIGMIGGGEHQILPITVSTYDSAKIYSHKLGQLFCFVVFDECHHLPTPGYAEMARALIAPYRLGLTATPVEDDARDELNNELCGTIVFQRDINDLSGEYLASYSVKRIRVQLSEEELKLYEYHRDIYLTFRKSIAPLLRGNFSWEEFVLKASITVQGRRAMKSFAIQKQIALSAEMKMYELAKILQNHKNERILIFTNDNKTALKISCLFFLPLITHETKSKERKLIIENFKLNKWPYLVSSRVLNEGIDLPEANIAVIISGTSIVREHVQRLGRILRQQKGKKAILYEFITEQTGEEYASQKRRKHSAYSMFH